MRGMTAGILPESVHPAISHPLALSFDLDDTLWPIWPTIERAERLLHTWLSRHAPRTAARFDAAGLRMLRDDIARRHPEWGHDLSRMRRESLREGLSLAGDDPGLAESGFDVFFEARQQVELYPDARDGLERLARRFPLVAVTNGNSDLARVGLDHLFQDSFSAMGFGVGKPDARIFHAACDRLGVAPASVLHVGDDLLLDVNGALDAGLRAVWLRRGIAATEPAPALAAPYEVFPDLAALADALGC
jgi:FMN hydrolase / 5-amino-6-(5-phospho-D-ribitylamino)uracil phosphatase